MIDLAIWMCPPVGRVRISHSIILIYLHYSGRPGFISPKIYKSDQSKGYELVQQSIPCVT